MREFALVIDEALSRGLRPEQEMIGHDAFLKECYNMKPIEGGLEGYVEPTDPFNGGVSTNWPWPQIFLTGEHSFLAKETELHTLGTASVPWTTSQVTTWDVDNTSSQKAIPAGGGVWHLIDLGEAFYLVKGNATVFGTGIHRAEDESQKVYVDDDTTIQTGTSHKGRAVVGGFDSANLWGPDWQSIFSSFQSEAASDVDFAFDDIDENWVMWSSVGGGDIPLWLFYPDDNPFDIQLDKDNLLKRLLRNEMGWMPMPYQGKVLKLAVLGEALVAYGENGIAVMQLTAAENIQGVGDPVPSTYGVRQVAEFGVAGRGAVAVGRGGHVFLSEHGEAWSLNAELQLERLGYQEYLGNMPARTVTSGWNPEEEEFFLCSDQEGFLFNGRGLAEHRDHITGGDALDGTFYALSHSPTTSDIEVVTNEASMKLQALKRVNNAQANISGVSDASISLQFRHDRNDGFSSIGPRGLNKEGVAWLRANGLDFRVKVEAAPLSNPRLNQVTMRYQLPDKRAIRGPFADVG